jgi:hypothetical protein
MSALGQKRTGAMHPPTSALTPIATAKSGHAAMAMSALPLKADVCEANMDVG